MEQLKKSQILNTATVFLFLLSLVGIALIAGGNESAKIVRFDNEESGLITGISVNGNEAFLPFTLETDEKVTLELTLNEDELYGECLAFYTWHCDVTVYLDSEMIFKFPKLSTPFPLTVGSHWQVFKLPADYDGKTLKISLAHTEDDGAHFSKISEIISGSKNAIVFSIINRAFPAMIVSLVIMCVGLIAIMLGLFTIRRKEGLRIICLGLFSVACSLWELSELRLSQISVVSLPSDLVIDFSCLALIPVFLSAFVLTYDELRHRLYVRLSFWLSVFTFALMHILQISDLVDYYEFLPVNFTVLGISVVIFCVSLFRMNIKKNRQLYAVYVGVVILFIAAMSEIILYYSVEYVLTGLLITPALLLFIILTGYSTVMDIKNLVARERKDRIFDELAVTDIMTGLPNRLAFDKKMNDLRECDPALLNNGKNAIMMADINYLKHVNDVYGHEAGDEIIIKTAELLKANFEGIGNCYRMGGDEFCVITGNYVKKEFDAALNAFVKFVGKYDAKKKYGFSVATGLCVMDESGADECLKKADSLMYENKAKMKAACEDIKTNL